MGVDWDTALVAMGDLQIRLGGVDRFVVHHAASGGEAVELDGRGLALLSAFSTPATPDQLFDDFAEHHPVSSAQFQEAVGALLDSGLLRADAEPPMPRLIASSFAQLRTQLDMLADDARLAAYREALGRYAAGKRVLDLGCGSGILSLLALQAGATEVIAVEETAIADLAQALFEANGVADRVTLHRMNSMALQLDEPVDLIVHEIFGADPFSENLLLFLGDARRRLLKPGGRLLPQRLQVLALGLSVERWQGLPQMRQVDQTLSERYGIVTSPITAALHNGVEAVVVFESDLPGHLLSEAQLVYDIDLAEEAPELLQPQRCVVTISDTGELNGVVLCFRALFDSSLQISTHPAAPKTHWPHVVHHLTTSRQVTAGDAVALVFRGVVSGGRPLITVAFAP